MTQCRSLDPEHAALLSDSVGLALLVILETLSPDERLAFVLHDMFAVPFEEIASIVGRSPAATRQLASVESGGTGAVMVTGVLSRQGCRLVQVVLLLILFSSVEGFAIPHLGAARIGLHIATASTRYSCPWHSL